MVVTVDLFYEQASQGKFLGLKCPNGHITVPPRRSCGDCNSLELESVQLSGRGQIIAFTTVNVKSKDFPLQVPYVLALVGLVEGGQLLGVANAREAELKKGTNVSVKFRKVQNEDMWPRIFFEINE